MGNLTFFCHVWDTQSDLEMSGDFLIYVERTAEVMRNSWQISTQLKECKDPDTKGPDFPAGEFKLNVILNVIAVRNCAQASQSNALDAR